MSVMYCNVNLFTLNQEVSVVNDDGTVERLSGVTIDNFTRAIPALCDERNIQNVKIYGLTDFVNQLAKDIDTNNKTNYKNNTLFIEVN